MTYEGYVERQSTGVFGLMKKNYAVLLNSPLPKESLETYFISQFSYFKGNKDLARTMAFTTLYGKGVIAFYASSEKKDLVRLVHLNDFLEMKTVNDTTLRIALKGEIVHLVFPSNEELGKMAMELNALLKVKMDEESLEFKELVQIFSSRKAFTELDPAPEMKALVDEMITDAVEQSDAEIRAVVDEMISEAIQIASSTKVVTFSEKIEEIPVLIYSEATAGTEANSELTTLSVHMEPKPVNPFKVLKVGVMHKQGRYNKRAWKNRYFMILENGDFVEYADIESRIPKRTHSLKTGVSVSDYSGKKFAFKVQVNYQKFVLAADSEQEKQEWIALLEQGSMSAQ